MPRPGPPPRPLSPAAIAGLAIAAFAAAPAAAQSVYAGLGSSGLAFGYAHAYGDSLGSRAEVSTVPRSQRTFVEDGISYSGRIEGTRAAALLDWRPFAGTFRLSGGVSFGSLRGGFDGAPTTTGTITIGGSTVTYGPQDAYAVRVELPPVAPYVGLGWGHAPVRGWGFHADLGVLVGEPEVTGSLSPSLRAKIAATGADPDAELERELSTVRESAASFKAYPVLSLGVSYRW